MHSLLPGIDSLGKIHPGWRSQNTPQMTSRENLQKRPPPKRPPRKHQKTPQKAPPPQSHPPGVPLPTKQKPPKMTIFKAETLQKGLLEPTTPHPPPPPPFLGVFAFLEGVRNVSGNRKLSKKGQKWSKIVKKGGFWHPPVVVGSKRPFCNVSALKMVILGGFCSVGKGTPGGCLKNVKKQQKRG